MQPIDETQAEILAEMNQYNMQTTYRCANCGAWQGEEHQPTCAGPKPVIVEVPKP